MPPCPGARNPILFHHEVFARSSLDLSVYRPFSSGKGFARQRPPERATLGGRPPTAIAVQQLVGAPGQHPTDLPPLALDPRDRHVVVARGPVPHPGDHGGFSPLLDRDASCPGDRAAADRRGVLGDGPCQPVGESDVTGVERQECRDGPVEVLDVLGLGLPTPPGCGLLTPGVDLGGALGLQFGPDALDGRPRSPDAPGEGLPPPLLLDGPVIACGLDPAGQPGVPRRHEDPPYRCGDDRAVGGPDRVRCRTGSEGCSSRIGVQMRSP